MDYNYCNTKDRSKIDTKTTGKLLQPALVAEQNLLPKPEDTNFEISQVNIDLLDAIMSLENKEEARNFLFDICTPGEIKALQERWRVCQLLYNTDLSYRQIHQKTGASLTTIGRVARFLREEKYGGYINLLEKIKGK